MENAERGRLTGAAAIAIAEDLIEVDLRMGVGGGDGQCEADGD